MSGKGKGKGGNGGRGRGRGNNGGRGHNYKGKNTTTKSGLCKALGAAVYDYGQKSSADLMRSTTEKLIEHVGTQYGQDICNELLFKTPVVIPEPVHQAATLTRHAVRQALVRAAQTNMRQALQAKLPIVQAAVTAGTDPDAGISLAELQNDIARTDFEILQDVPVEMTHSEKTLYDNEWKVHRDRSANLVKHRG